MTNKASKTKVYGLTKYEDLLSTHPITSIELSGYDFQDSQSAIEALESYSEDGFRVALTITEFGFSLQEYLLDLDTIYEMLSPDNQTHILLQSTNHIEFEFLELEDLEKLLNSFKADAIV